MIDSRGLHDKYEVRRRELDVDHDQCARVALAAYIKAAKEPRPRLARDLEVMLACLEAEEDVDK